MKKIVALFLVWRILLFIPLFFSEKLLIYRKGYEYTNIWYFFKPSFPLSHILFYPWANFDGVHYLSIAAQGYVDNGRFFPLYPILIHLLSFGAHFGTLQFMVALLISNVSFLLALVLLYKLLLLDYSEKIAWQTLIFLLVFPTSFFFASIYTESIFLLLTVFSFYCARKKFWLGASVCGFFLTLTRPVGIVILPALLYEFFRQEKREKTTAFFLKLSSFCLIPLGLISYMIYNASKWGDALYFLKAQGALANGRSTSTIVLLPQTLYRYGKILATISVTQYDWFVAMIELSACIFALGLLFYAWRKKVRISYLIFSVLAFLMPTSTGTFSGLPRYIIVIFPLFLGIALTKNKIIKILYVVISLILLFILTVYFARGYYVA